MADPGKRLVNSPAAIGPFTFRDVCNGPISGSTGRSGATSAMGKPDAGKPLSRIPNSDAPKPRNYFRLKWRESARNTIYLIQGTKLFRGNRAESLFSFAKSTMGRPAGRPNPARCQTNQDVPGLAA